MTRLRVASTPLVVLALTLLGCSQPSPSVAVEPPLEAPADAGTEATWDGSSVALEERGNWPVDPGAFAPCSVVSAVGSDCDARNFDLSACDTASLARVPDEGVYMLTIRQPNDDPDYPMDIYTEMLTLPGAGGTPRIGTRQATVEQVGPARVFSTTIRVRPDGKRQRVAVALCQSSQPAELTGCFATCVNDRLASFGLGTLRAERMTWREGERESSGLELVSERFVDIGMPVDVYVTQGHAYVVSVPRGPQPGGLTVFDVREPTSPVKVKTVQFNGDSYWNGVWSKGNALYVASANNGVLVFDITEPANPRLVTSLPGQAANNHTVFVDGDRLYAALNESVTLYDISTPTHPVELSRYVSEDGLAYPHDMFAVGDRLYISYAEVGYLVVDVSDPVHPRTLGNYSYLNQFSHANAVGTFAGRSLAFMGGEGPGEHLRVLDITDPANMVKIGRFQLRPAVSIHNMLLVGQKLYVAWYQEGVRVLDVSNPTQPRQTAYFNTFRETDPNRGDYFDGAIGIRLPGDGFLYTVDTSRGLLLLREK
jgi:hypothetical protein